MKKHKTIKKVFAILMALSVIFSYSVVAMADTGEPPKTSAEQIGNYFEADDATGALATSTSLEADYTQQSYAGGQVLVNKTIAGTDTENEFEITLDITTKNKIEEMDTSPDAAAVLVIDISGSMNDSLGKKQGNRIEAAQKAAQAFVDSFQSKTATRKVAVVTFSGDEPEQELVWDWHQMKFVKVDVPGTGINGATTILGWTDAKELKIDGGNDSEIDKLTANGGTNMEAGIKLAENLLKSSAVSDIKNKNIILLTDGKPTFGIDDDSKETSDSFVCYDGTNMIGDGGNTSHDVHTQVETKAKALSSAGVGTYAVYVGDEKVDCTGKNDCRLKKDVASWLGTDCGFVAKQSTDVDEITNIFENISKLIEIRAKAWQLSDKMGDNITFESDLTEPGTPDGLSYDSDSKTLKWNLYATLPKELKDNDGKVRYEYTYTYKIKLNNLADGFEANKEYPTNGVTSLSYFIEDSSSMEKPELSYAYFNVPSVKGFAGDFSFTKVNELGHPMTGVAFTLTTKDDSSFVRTATSSEAGTVSFANIPSGHKYVLHEVAAPENYVAAADKDVTVSYGNVSATIVDGKIENVPDTTDITVRKVWSDGKDQDGKRPSSIQVQLYANGDKEGSSVELNAGNNWSYTFTNLPKAADGQAITYTVDEENVPDGYTKSVNGFIITNSHSPETTTVSGQKTWVGDETEEEIEEEVVPPAENPDAVNPDKAERTAPKTRTVVNESRPDSIIVNLLADGTKIDSRVVTATDNWSWSFTNLPVYNNGNKIVYTVTEDTVPDYVTSIDGYNITNTYSPNKTSVTVNKDWKDNGNQDGIRPTSVTVKLLAGGEETGKTVTLNAENNWQATFADLDARTVESDASTTINYTVEEVGVPDGYVPDVSGSMASGYTITNTHIPETTAVTVKKAWDDNEDKADARPDSVTVRLLADGVETGKTVTLNAANEWTASFTNLAKKANGNVITYSVAENAVIDYTMTGNTFEEEEGVFVITNKYTPDTKNITVKKVWNDVENKDNIRPEDITVTIKNGEKTVATQIITEGDGWTYTFKGLLKREAGKEITYTVEESPVEGYTSSVSVDTNGDFIITNTHTPEEKPPVTPIIPPFTPESVYTVTYMDGVDDEVVFEDQSTTNLKKGDKTPAFNGEPVREGYKFIGWSPVVAETVTGDAVYYAQWEKLPEEPSVVDPSGDNDPIDDGKDIDAQPNGDADTEAKGVKTGDETMLAMWGALGLIAALGLGGTLVIGRRREE